jgi:membrane protein implicated in regulation of membrane protease activity
MELIVIGIIYVAAFTVFTIIVATDHDPGAFATYSIAALTALLPFLRKRKPNGEDENDNADNG